MHRRRLLSAAGFGVVGFAGCLSNAGDDAASPAEPPDDATIGDCPETDAEPPTDLSTAAAESFVEEFEADQIAASAAGSMDATRSGSVTAETTVVEDGVARVDASGQFSGRGWDGYVRLRPLEGKGDEPTDGDASDGPEELERVSTSTDPIPEAKTLLEAVDDAIETGDTQTVDDAGSLEALASASGGEYGEDLLLEHDGHVLLVENAATAWESIGEWFVGYLLTDERVYRTEHDREDWRDREYGEPLEVPDDEWERLECWS